jgi:RNA polymerase sigma factor (TIGR02999 family)
LGLLFWLFWLLLSSFYFTSKKVFTFLRSTHNANSFGKDHHSPQIFLKKIAIGRIFIVWMEDRPPKEAPDAQEVTQLLMSLNAGNREVVDDLVPLVYKELRRLAGYYLKNERQGHTLQPTALVHEAFLKLVEQETAWQNRTHFFAMAASLMRRILVDYARGRGAEKRGGSAEKVSLDDADAFVKEKPAQMIALDEAMKELGRVDPRRAQVVELRFFGGLNNEEIAEVLGVHSNTVVRDWNLARAWLKTQLR